MKQLTAERLREMLTYDPDTGVFSWNVPTKKIRIGDVAGGMNIHGYGVIGIDKHTYLAHRLAWLYVHGVWPANEVDHRDSDKTNNRIANLREATTQQNQHNRVHAQTNSKSGVLGVSRTKVGRPWQAFIKLNGCQKYLGRFSSQNEAHAAYIAAKRQLHPYGVL